MQKDASWDAYICLSTCICMQMLVYMAAYGHIYPYTHHFGAREVRKILFIAAFIPKKLVRATPSWHSYGAVPISLQGIVAPT